MDLKTFLPVDCIKYIFSHFKGRDLLKCTLVCPAWNDYIGSTSSCMEKIKLKCSGLDSLEHLESILRESNRKYTCLLMNVDLVDSQEFCESVQTLVFMNSRPWTYIFADGLDFKSINQFQDFLRIFEPTIQKLSFFIEEIGEDYKPGFQSSVLQYP